MVCGDYYYVFEAVEQALAFSQETSDTQKPLALIVQAEYIGEPEKGTYVYVDKCRVTQIPSTPAAHVTDSRRVLKDI